MSEKGPAGLRRTLRQPQARRKNVSALRNNLRRGLNGEGNYFGELNKIVVRDVVEESNPELIPVEFSVGLNVVNNVLCSQNCREIFHLVSLINVDGNDGL